MSPDPKSCGILDTVAEIPPQSLVDTGSGGGTLNSGECGVATKTGTVAGKTVVTAVTATNCANYSVDVAPDMVLKAAFDPGWGHYEVFGLGRIIQTRSGLFKMGQTLPLTRNSLIDLGNNEALAGGVGGNLILPIMPKVLDFQTSVLAGRGIGQYGSAQFADSTVNQFGDPSPIPMIQTLTGLVAHPNPSLDVFFYGGYEKAFKDTFASATPNTVGGGIGYGSNLDNNTGCNIENSNNFAVPAGALPFACSGFNKDVWQLTGGLWDKVYMGKHGTVSVGLQYSYTQREPV